MPKRSLRKIIEDAMKNVGEIVIDPRLKEELKDCFRNEGEVVYSSDLADASEPIYKPLRANVKYRKVKNKAMKLKGGVLKIVNKSLIEGPGMGRGLEIYARVNGLKNHKAW